MLLLSRILGKTRGGHVIDVQLVGWTRYIQRVSGMGIGNRATCDRWEGLMCEGGVCDEWGDTRYPTSCAVLRLPGCTIKLHFLSMSWIICNHGQLTKHLHVALWVAMAKLDRGSTVHLHAYHTQDVYLQEEKSLAGALWEPPLHDQGTPHQHQQNPTLSRYQTPIPKGESPGVWYQTPIPKGVSPGVWYQTPIPKGVSPGVWYQTPIPKGVSPGVWYRD